MDEVFWQPNEWGECIERSAWEWAGWFELSEREVLIRSRGRMEEH